MQNRIIIDRTYAQPSTYVYAHEYAAYACRRGMNVNVYRILGVNSFGVEIPTTYSLSTAITELIGHSTLAPSRTRPPDGNII